MKAGYPPIDIKLTDRLKYYETFDKYHARHNVSAMANMFARYLNQRLEGKRQKSVSISRRVLSEISLYCSKLNVLYSLLMFEVIIKRTPAIHSLNML